MTMNEHRTLGRLRTFLRALVAALFAGTIVELILAGHTESLMQWVPFVLCGLGLLTLAADWLWSTRGTAFTLRAVMAAVACGSLLGVSQHFLGNRDFARETNPQAGAGTILRRSVTGADPLLAPGILAVAAAIAIASTFAASDAEAVAAAQAERDVTAVR
jgi:hypothetical protein